MVLKNHEPDSYETADFDKAICLTGKFLSDTIGNVKIYFLGLAFDFQKYIFGFN